MKEIVFPFGKCALLCCLESDKKINTTLVYIVNMNLRLAADLPSEAKIWLSKYRELVHKDNHHRRRGSLGFQVDSS